MNPDTELLLGEPEWGPDTPQSFLEPLEARESINQEGPREMALRILEDILVAAQLAQEQGETTEREERREVTMETTGLEDSWERLYIQETMANGPQVCSNNGIV